MTQKTTGKSSASFLNREKSENPSSGLSAKNDKKITSLAFSLGLRSFQSEGSRYHNFATASNHEDSKGRILKEVVSNRNLSIISYALVFGSSLFGVCFLYGAVLSKHIPQTNIYILDQMKKDAYFCYLIPLLIVPTYIVIYLNWLSMKLFQHN